MQVGCEGVEVCRWGVRCGGVQVGCDGVRCAVGCEGVGLCSWGEKVGSCRREGVLHSPQGMQGSCWWDESSLGSYVGTHFLATLPLQVAHAPAQETEQEIDS